MTWSDVNKSSDSVNEKQSLLLGIGELLMQAILSLQRQEGFSDQV